MTRSEFGAGFSLGREARGGVAVKVMVGRFKRCAEETARKKYLHFFLAGDVKAFYLSCVDGEHDASRNPNH